MAAKHQAEKKKEGGQGAGVATLFVSRPVLAIVLNLLIVVAGLAAYSGIEVRELPNIDQPVVTIRTTYTGATPETIDKEITGIIEGAVARTPGVVAISSQSSAGRSNVTVQFDSSTDINVAANDLRDAVGNLRGLPTESAFTPPTIVKADTGSDAIMRLAVTSQTMPIDQLTGVVNDVIVDRLAAVNGVADVQLFGDRDPLVRILINTDALAARNLTVNDLLQALNTVTLDAPAGNVADNNQSLLLRADATTKSAEEIGAIQINPNVKVSDVADVIFGPADTTTTLRINAQNGVGLAIVRQAKSNSLDISSGVHAAVDELNKQLPEGVKLTITSDDATYIRDSIREVILTLALATAIVVAIIYLFLRSLRVTFIPAVTVPIALVGTFAAIWAAGFSINILTLLALVLATGLVVDDAIVVIENISRQRGLGMGPRAAAVLGVRQVFFAVLSITATLVAVFVPISFFPGVAGRLFSEFGFVLAFAVILSSFVALTLSPMLASRLVGDEEHAHHNRFSQALGNFGERCVRLYARLLDAALAAPAIVIVIAVIFAGGAYFAFRVLPSELTPPEDRGSIPLSVRGPPGATVDFVADQMRRVEGIMRPYVQSGEIVNTFSTAQGGGGGGFMFATLADWNKRTRSQADITAELNRKLQNIPGIQVSAFTSNSLGIRGGGQGLQFSITGTDYTELGKAADKLIAAMQDDPVFATVRLNFDTTQPQLSVNIDRERASSVGVSVSNITSAIQTLVAGNNLGNYYIADQPIEILAQAPDGTIEDATGLENVEMRSDTGKMVPLSSLVTFQESAVAPTLARESQRRAMPISATLAPGVDLRQAMNHMEAIAAKNLPAGTGYVYTGEAKELNNASSGVIQTFAFALLVVVLVLAAQFESFSSALILMATVPFGLASAMYAIVLTGGSLNIYSEIGLVMLVGLMSKNGILMVEFANQLRDQGQSVLEAIRNAALIRLRPIVMTMIATVLGGLPLLLTGGAGAEARRSLGWIIVGGLGFATIATLFLTPVVFTLLARFSKPRIAEERRLERELAEAEAIAPRGLTPSGHDRADIAELPAAAE